MWFGHGICGMILCGEFCTFALPDAAVFARTMFFDDAL